MPNGNVFKQHSGRSFSGGDWQEIYATAVEFVLKKTVKATPTRRFRRDRVGSVFVFLFVCVFV